MKKPLDYQKDGVLHMERFNGRALLADEQGLGKTIQALLLLRRNPSWGPVVVCCPGVAKYNWEAEIREWLGAACHVCEGQTPPDYRGLTKSKIYVINYEILRHWLPYLLRMGIKTVILDECQYLGNEDTQRTEAAQELCRTCEHVVGLSGTPLTNRPRELWPALNMIRPDKFRSYSGFCHQFCDPRYTPWGWDFDGASNISQLHELLTGTVMIRRLKKDVLDIPPKARKMVITPLAKAQEYHEANEKFLPWLRRNFGTGKAARAARSERMVKMGYMKQLAAKLKAPNVVKWMNNFLETTGEKLVVFAYHQKMVQGLLRRANCKACVIDGNTIGREREDIKRRFQTDPNTRLLIGSTAAITAITLTAARTVAFAELYWRPGDHNQGEDRIHRIGQDRDCRVNYLVAPDTIENHLAKVIQRKQRVISNTLDGRNAVDQRLDIYDQVTEELLSENSA